MAKLSKRPGAEIVILKRRKIVKTTKTLKIKAVQNCQNAESAKLSKLDKTSSYNYQKRTIRYRLNKLKMSNPEKLSIPYISKRLKM